MLFNEILGIQNKVEKENYIIRVAVRAVIIHNNKILMLFNNKGDYKFPGGGVEKGEDLYDALQREVLEESGYVVTKIGEKIGMTLERREDRSNHNTLFEMTSHYYDCEVDKEPMEPSLTASEAALDFRCVWISVEDAIANNEKVIKEKENINPWVPREVFALKALQNSSMF